LMLYWVKHFKAEQKRYFMLGVSSAPTYFWLHVRGYLEHWLWRIIFRKNFALVSSFGCVRLGTLITPVRKNVLWYALFVRFRGSNVHLFDQTAHQLETLRQGNSKEIIALQNSSSGFTAQLLKKFRLPAHILQEVLSDASIIFLKKLREPEFFLDSAQPRTYFIEIIKRVVLNETRKRQDGKHEQIENQFGLPDASVEEYQAQKENIELLGQLLSGAGAPCEQVIRLKYIDGFSDEEAIRRSLTAYSTVESLRQKRSDCMKRLKDRATAFKEKMHF